MKYSYQKIGQLQGDALSLAIAQSLDDGPTIIFAKNARLAQLLAQTLPFFTNRSLIVFEDLETLPYDRFSPHKDRIATRIAQLLQLPHLQSEVVIVSLPTAMQKLPPKHFLQRYAASFSVGMHLQPETLVAQLEDAGYQGVMKVQNPGEYRRQGEICDLYLPAGSPLRLVFDENRLEAIRALDLDTQRSTKHFETFSLTPGALFPRDKPTQKQFASACNAYFSENNHPLAKAFSTDLFTKGLESYLPFFYAEPLAHFFDYVPTHSTCFLLDDDQKAVEHFHQQLLERYNLYRHDIERPAIAPDLLYLSAELFFQTRNGFKKRYFSQAAVAENPPKSGNIDGQALPSLAFTQHGAHSFSKLQSWLKAFQGSVLFTSDSPARMEQLQALLRGAQIVVEKVPNLTAFLEPHAPKYALSLGALDEGYIFGDSYAIIPEAQLFGWQPQIRSQLKREKTKKSKLSPPSIVHLGELQPDDIVVHANHGIAQYKGLKALALQGETSEFMHLEYADGASLYVPIHSLHLISKYQGIGNRETALDRLGSKRFAKDKEAAKEQLEDIAAKLLDLYATRLQSTRAPYPIDSEAYAEFARAFPFDETDDQRRSIEAVITDLKKDQPMDRLICGDVGFGKTEVAARAAFIVAHSGKQVAILVPTTLLAAQHYESFCNRFAGWPIRIALLSRFRTNKEVQDTLKGLAAGSIDIVIGTHKLLQTEVRFHKLGLVILDEEHRFGVKQKEVFKNLRHSLDVLAMTATPIPRSLHMALSSLRDLSIIATPPKHRLSIQTFVQERNPGSICEAILREMYRGGQVYYLHNEVQSIEKAQRELSALLPEVRFAVAHGQMHKNDLERVMSAFYHHHVDVLICSTIIETGIDVPLANTILIDDADRLGLAQLHQIRGRVGRSHHQAYAYLFTRPEEELTKEAKLRLEALTSLDSLGAGFALANHDLEIRGAGELLGEGQSGKINGIGFSLYTEMLQETIGRLQQQGSATDTAPHKEAVDIHWPCPALIPEKFLPDVQERLLFYRRLSSAETEIAIEDIANELADRFGTLPESIHNLIALAKVRLHAKQLGMEKVEHKGKGLHIYFSAQPQIDPVALLQLVQTQPNYRLLQGGRYLQYHPLAEHDLGFRLFERICAALAVK